MHEHAPQEIRPGPPPAAAGTTAPNSAGEDRFTLRKKFPGEGVAAPLAPSRAPDVRSKSGRRIIAALIVFLGVVGIIAYVAQNLPNWRKRGTPGGDNTDPTLVKEILKFPEDLRDLALPTLFHARWDHPDPKQLMYPAEIEKGSKGHYDFLLFNPLEQTVDLGLFESSCDCSKVDFTPLPTSAD